MTTLKDIAREAGVSVMTVSNVVNGNFSKVSPQTAERIQEIIKRLNYVPNFSARSLVKSDSHIISVILRGEIDQNPLENPYNAALIGTIIQKIQQQGYYAMINIMKSVSDISQNLRTWNAEGAILLGMFDDEIEQMCSVSDIPMVFTDSYSHVRQLSNVGIDDYKGGQLAARHFIENGHRSLCFIGPPSLHTGVIQQRYLGFCDELHAHDISFNPNYYFTLKSDVDFDEITLLGEEVAKYKGKITGAFITSDQIASFLINILAQNNVRVPEDLSLIGFDNLPICRQITPQLTTISQDLQKKAELTVDILFRRLLSPDAPVESMVLDVSLINRHSVRSLQNI